MINWEQYGPVTQVLRLSDDSLCYEWSDAAVFKNEETGYYAFYSSSGCSCSYFEEEWSREFFQNELVWNPTPLKVYGEALAWVRSDISDPAERLRKLEAVLRSLNEETNNK